MDPVLKDKVAIIYGGGPIGSTIAKAFAREGATIFLAARSLVNIKKLADEINQHGGKASVTKVDVHDKESVEKFVDAVVAKTGRVDISFCATNISGGGEQGAALSEISYEDFSLPILHYMQAQFFTTNAAAKQMVKQGSGVIMMITAIASQIPAPYTAGFGPAWAAMEAHLRTLAAELGPYGIRTVCLHSAGSPESMESIQRTFTKNPAAEKRINEWKFVNRNLLNKWPTLEQVGDMAAFMASDKAGATTGTSVSLTGGMVNN
jgi:NAD(P)-dependent dehydrogenase (short-subunit alcohol dehydrogenase family)